MNSLFNFLSKKSAPVFLFLLVISLAFFQNCNQEILPGLCVIPDGSLFYEEDTIQIVEGGTAFSVTPEFDYCADQTVNEVYYVIYGTNGTRNVPDGLSINYETGVIQVGPQLAPGEYQLTITVSEVQFIFIDVFTVLVAPLCPEDIIAASLTYEPNVLDDVPGVDDSSNVPTIGYEPECNLFQEYRTFAIENINGLSYENETGELIKAAIKIDESSGEVIVYQGLENFPDQYVLDISVTTLASEVVFNNALTINVSADSCHPEFACYNGTAVPDTEEEYGCRCECEEGWAGDACDESLLLPTVGTLTGFANMEGFVDGLEATAQFNQPAGIDTDLEENYYVADVNNHSIRKISFVNGQYITSTIAGTGSSGDTNGPAAVATFNQPADVAVDADQNIYIADTENKRIRKYIHATGEVITYAGSTSGIEDGPALEAKFLKPQAVKLSDDGNLLYVGDISTIRVITIADSPVDRIVTTIIGSSSATYSDGTGSAGKVNNIADIDLDNEGNLIVADQGNNAIRKVIKNGASYTISTLAGGPNTIAVPNNLNFDRPSGVYYHEGFIYVTDSRRNKVRKVGEQNGTFSVTVLAGPADTGFNDEESGYVDAMQYDARFSNPYGITYSPLVDALIITDRDNHNIRAIQVFD